MENGLSPVLLREVNDRAYNVLLGLAAEAGDFACECGEKGCHERVDLLVIEYAARGHEAVLAPGHKQVASAVS